MLATIKKYFNRTFFLCVLGILLFLIFNFLLLKKGYYYSAIDKLIDVPYEQLYTYFQMDASRMFVDKTMLMYQPYNYNFLFSTIPLYFATFSTTIFRVFTFLFPVLIFLLVYRSIGSELLSGFYQSILLKIGKIRYMVGSIVGCSLLGGFICIMPKLLYFGILRLFFVGGYSLERLITNSDVVYTTFQLSEYTLGPWEIFFIDLGMSFLYGAFLALLALAIIIILRNGYTACIVYIMIILAQCIFGGMLDAVYQILIHCYCYMLYANGDLVSTVSIFSMLSLFLIVIIGFDVLLFQRKAYQEL